MILYKYTWFEALETNFKDYKRILYQTVLLIDSLYLLRNSLSVNMVKMSIRMLLFQQICFSEYLTFLKLYHCLLNQVTIGMSVD